MSQEPTFAASADDSSPDKPDQSGRRRTFRKWFTAAFAVILLAVVGGLLSVDYLGRIAIERAGTHALGVTTTLDKLSLSVFSGNSTLTGFQVANPEGFESRYFLRLDSGSLDMSIRNVLNETVEVEQLALTGIHLNLVREEKEANYRTIIDNIRRFEDEIADRSGADRAPGKRFIIRSVIIRDVQVKVDLLPIGGKLTQLEVPIDLIELNDVGAESSRGENVTRLIATIVRALLEAVLAKGDSLLPADTLDELKGKLSEMKPMETLRAVRSSLQEQREERREERQQRTEPRRRPLAPLRERRLQEK